MLLDHRQLCIVEVLSHIGDETGNYGSRDVEPLLLATAPRKVLNIVEERDLVKVIEYVGHCYQGGSG